MTDQQLSLTDTKCVLIETYWNVNLEMWCEKLGGSSY